MHLAERVIEENERENEIPKERRSWEEDDIGVLYDPEKITIHVSKLEYLVERILKLNADLRSKDKTILWKGQQPLKKGSTVVIAELADIPIAVSKAEAIWIYKKLLDKVPNLDRKIVRLSPIHSWDVEKHNLVRHRGRKGKYNRRFNKDHYVKGRIG